MPEKLVLYDLAPSPNNMKARIALNYKELPFEKIPVEGMGDRADVIHVSRQPLTPVLKHGETVVWDSAAILRHLEGNFPNTRPIFSTDYATMKKIEEWESFGRRELLDSVGMTFGQVFAEKKDPEVTKKATALLRENSERLEKHLAGRSWLVGDAMTAADISCAPMVYYGMLPSIVAGLSPIHQFFAENLVLGSGRDNTRAWVTRVMAYDR